MFVIAQLCFLFLGIKGLTEEGTFEFPPCAEIKRASLEKCFWGNPAGVVYNLQPGLEEAVLEILDRNDGNRWNLEELYALERVDEFLGRYEFIQVIISVAGTKGILHRNVIMKRQIQRFLVITSHITQKNMCR